MQRGGGRWKAVAGVESTLDVVELVGLLAGALQRGSRLALASPIEKLASTTAAMNAAEIGG